MKTSNTMNIGKNALAKHKKYYTTGDIAKYCEVDINTVKHWIRTGNLMGFKTPSGHYRVIRKRFIEFIKTQGFMYDPKYFGKEVYLPTVLVVDDDPTHRELIVYMLHHLYPKILIETAENGFDGYMIMHQKNPDLILLDLKMESIDGLEFIRVMRTYKKLNGINLVIISAHLNSKKISEIKELDVDTILQKPVSEKVLAAACDSTFNGKK